MFLLLFEFERFKLIGVEIGETIDDKRELENPFIPCWDPNKCED